MAKLWILSDLHLETLPDPDNFRPAPLAFDVLVAAGDIQEGDPGRGFAILRRLAGEKPIVCVMGNHEHWNGVVDEDLAFAKVLATRAGVTLLDGTRAVHAGCQFVGTTLWSDYRLAGRLDPDPPTGEPIDVAHDEHGGSHLITVGDAAALHRRARAALAARIAEADATLPLVVVTHHAPPDRGPRLCSSNRPAVCAYRMARPAPPPARILVRSLRGRSPAAFRQLFDGSAGLVFPDSRT